MANAKLGTSSSSLIIWLPHLPVTSGTPDWAAEAAAGRKKNSELQKTVTDVHDHISCHGNPRIDQQPWTRVSQRPWKAHLPSVRDVPENALLFQRLSVLIQRFNSVAVQGIFAHMPTEDEFYTVPAFSVLKFRFKPQYLYYRGYEIN